MFLGVPIFKPIIIRLYFAQILGHLKMMNFLFGTNGKFIVFRCPNTLAHYGNCVSLSGIWQLEIVW